SRQRGRLPIAADDVAQCAERAAEVALHVFTIAAMRGDDPIGQPREGQRLDPDAPRTGQRREEQSFAAEDRRLDAADELDVVVDGRTERAQTAGVAAQLLARRELHRNDGAAAVDEHVAVAFETLQNESFAAEKPRAEALGELDVDVDLPRRAEKR